MLFIQVDNDKLHHGIEYWPSFLLCIFSFFFLSTFFVKDITTTIWDRKFIFSIRNDIEQMYHGIETWLCPVCSSHIQDGCQLLLLKIAKT